ncbi:hypothetical protein GF327_05800 [Candidatus Woesearchaeota archaeon]|nr:hypothetical protein [Candidatus Woesearchaeota archaeon]
MQVAIILMTIIGGFSKFYKRFIPVSIGLELKTFFIILISITHGINTAFIAAVLMVLVSAVISGRFCHWILIKIGVYALVVGIVAALSGRGVVFAGRAAVLFLNGAYLFFNVIFKDFRIFADLPGNIVNISFNFLLLGFFAEPLVSFL